MKDGRYMSEWKETKVSELGNVLTGKTPQTSHSEYYGGDIPFITPSDNMNVKYMRTTKKLLTIEGANSVNQHIIPAESVCVSCIGSVIGKAVIATKESVTNQQINSIVVDKEKYDVDFVYYQMVLLGKQLNYYSKFSSVVPIINKGNFLRYTIMCPELDEQRKISSFISLFDDKIEENERINNNLFEQMQALYKDWFVNFEPFGGVRPSGWNNTNIYAIANIIYGAPFASKLFNTDGLGKPIIRIRDLKEQTFVTFTTEEHPKGHLIQPGDIVVGMDGEFRPYIWGNEPAWLNQRVCIFESNRPKGKAFVLYTIKPLLNKIEQTQVATTVIHIGKKDFDAFEIVLPDEATLDSFDSITAPMVEKIVNNSLQNKRLAVLRDTLLPKLMSGELDVSNINL